MLGTNSSTSSAYLSMLNKTGIIKKVNKINNVSKYISNGTKSFNVVKKKIGFYGKNVPKKVFKHKKVMKTSKIIAAILGLLVLPIGFYLQYWMISQLNADRLIWFLFWMYVPIVVIVTVIAKLIEDN